jgi:hypothetical protein
LALFQSRFTRTGVIRRTSAASSTLNPPKFGHAGFAPIEFGQQFERRFQGHYVNSSGLHPSTAPGTPRWRARVEALFEP